MTFFSAIGSLGIASRLKRLSDMFMAETRAIYAAAGVEFEPRWFPVFFLLQERGEITVTEAASLIDVPHTYVSQLVKEMRQAKLVQFKRHPDDGRSRIVALTPKGVALVDVLKPMWEDIQDAVDTLIEQTGIDVLGTVKKMEQLLTETPTSMFVRERWDARAKEATLRNGSSPSKHTMHVRAIDRRDNPRVATIIRTVMREMGASGPGYSIHDVEVDHMSEAYGIPRAAYFVVVLDDRIVGGCGLGPLAGGDPDVCELKKMYVLPAGRGLGVGRMLLDRCLDAAREFGYTRCYLETMQSMQAAQRLYERAGFRTFEGPLGNTGHFSCDAYYVKTL